MRRRAGEAAGYLANHPSPGEAPPLRSYVNALGHALDQTAHWLPYRQLDSGFEHRRVLVASHPPPPSTEGQLYQAALTLPRGAVAWHRAIDGVAVAVVLADAGFGKSWLLRHHGHRLCRAALTQLAAGDDLAAVEIPLWMHAADLARWWDAGGAPESAVLAAALVEPRRIGYVPDDAVREQLTARLCRGAAPVHVLIDAYDEVFDDRLRAAVVDALRWLSGLFTAGRGPRIVLTSQPAGYDDPFDHRQPLDEDVTPELARSIFTSAFWRSSKLGGYGSTGMWAAAVPFRTSGSSQRSLPAPHCASSCRCH